MLTERGIQSCINRPNTHWKRRSEWQRGIIPESFVIKCSKGSSTPPRSWFPVYTVTEDSTTLPNTSMDIFTLNPENALLTIVQDGRSIEEYVEEFLALAEGVTWREETQKTIFWGGLDDHLYQLMPASDSTCSLGSYMGYALWLSGSPSSPLVPSSSSSSPLALPRSSSSPLVPPSSPSSSLATSSSTLPERRRVPALPERLPVPAPRLRPPVPAPRLRPPVPAPRLRPPVPAPRLRPPVPAPRLRPPVPAPRQRPPVPAPRLCPPVPAPRQRPPVPAPRQHPPVAAPRKLSPSFPLVLSSSALPERPRDAALSEHPRDAALPERPPVPVPSCVLCVLCFPSSRALIWLVPVPVLVSSS